MLEVLSELKGLAPVVHSHTHSFAKLEAQLGQMANNMNRREKGKLPSQTVANPKGQYGAESSGGNGKQHEQVQAVVALRSGRELEAQSVASDVTRVRKGDHGGSPSESKGEGETLKRDELVPSTPYVPKAPFP